MRSERWIGDLRGDRTTVLVRQHKPGNDGHWAPVSDLMATLMLIFMFIAIVYIRDVVEAEAVNHQKCREVYRILQTEFGQDFSTWDVELLEDLTIRFRNPEVLFQSGQDAIRPRFRRILSDFFPRYMAIIQSPDHREDIREVRIEGHTSSEWVDAQDHRDAYFLNMDLSQRRTSAILRFVLDLPESDAYLTWARSHISANGRSSSRLILTKEGIEDRVRSRRVEFRLLARSCQRAGMYEIDGVTDE